MSWLRRIFLFGLVNILMMVTITTVIQLLGLQSFFSQRGIDYGSLMVFCLVWGFGGLLSRSSFPVGWPKL